MAQPRQQQRRVLVALLLLLSVCLARSDAAVAASEASSGLKEGGATEMGEVLGQNAAGGLAADQLTTEEEEGPAVPERVLMAVIEDYPTIGPNNRHNPVHP